MNARRVCLPDYDPAGRVARQESAADASLPGVRLTLLDGFELRCCGESLSLPMVAQRLVAFLALHALPLHRTYVAGSLWFGGSDCDTQACLRSALWRVRRDCSVSVLASRTHVQLAPDVKVDVRDQIAVAQQSLDGSVPLDDLDRHLLEGELLPDWYDDWVLFERERLRQLRFHALETVALRLAEAGRYGEAVEEAFAALRGDELRESAHRILMRIYLAEGNQAEAIRQLGHYRHLLRSKLGVDPSPDLEALVHASFHR